VYKRQISHPEIIWWHGAQPAQIWTSFRRGAHWPGALLQIPVKGSVSLRLRRGSIRWDHPRSDHDL